MEKVKAWSLIIGCSFLLLIFLLVCIAITPGIIEGRAGEMTTKEIISSTLGTIIVMGLSVVGLLFGIKKIRPKEKALSQAYTKSFEMQVSGKVPFKDYRNLIFRLRYNRPLYYFLFGVLTLNLLALYVNSNGAYNGLGSFNIYTYAMLVLFLSPVATYISTKKNYRTSAFLNEEIQYSLSNSCIQVTGKTVEATLYWNHFHKIKETQRFFLLYQSNSVVTLLDKQLFSQKELQDLSLFVSSIT